MTLHITFSESRDHETHLHYLHTCIAHLKKAKPASSKGQYLKKLTVSSTMGPGVSIDQASVDV